MASLRSINKTLQFFTFLYCWTFILRAPTFLRSVIDWDESIYLIMAAQWADGHPPFTTVWDHMPVGIFMLFRLGFSLLGPSVDTIRFLGAIAVFLSAVFLFLLGRLLLQNSKAAAFAAIAYPVFSLGLAGLASYTEPFFICFNLGGLVCLAYSHSHPNPLLARSGLTMAGLLMGCAFQIKYLVGFEILVFFIWSAFIGFQNRKPWPSMKEMLSDCLYFGFGLALPTIAAFSYYWQQDLMAEFIYSNFEATLKHIQPEPVTVLNAFNKSMLDWFQWIWPIAAILVLGVISQARCKAGSGTAYHKRTAPFLLVWLGATLVESWVTRNFYGHYYLVTIPPLCCFLALSLFRLQAHLWSTGRIALLLLMIFISPLSGIVKHYYSPWLAEQRLYGKDLPALTAEYIAMRLSDNETIWVVNYHPIIYFLCNATLPTPYIFPPFLIWPHFSHVAGIDYQQEVDKILKKRPEFIVVERENRPRVNEIMKRIKDDYHIEATLGENLSILIYRINSSKSTRHRFNNSSSSLSSHPLFTNKL